jgi:hypothetical protein
VARRGFVLSHVPKNEGSGVAFFGAGQMWATFNHYATDLRGAVEIESERTARLCGPLIAWGRDKWGTVFHLGLGSKDVEPMLGPPALLPG